MSLDTDLFSVVHHSHQPFAVVERRVPTERVTEAWRAICRHERCIGKHCENHQPIFWYGHWFGLDEREKADTDAQDHNDACHRATA